MTSRAEKKREERSVGRCHANGKAKFTTRRAAKANAKYHGHRDLHAYRCEECGYFHLGHSYGHDRQWHRELKNGKD